MFVGMADLLGQIRTLEPSLSRSERKVALVVLSQPDKTIHSTLADLANLAEVSEPTVLRFCRTIGCEGFQDFKVRLAQSLVTSFSYSGLEIDPDDAAATFYKKIFNGTIDMLVKVRNQVDDRALEEAITALSQAHKIEFYGVGASGAVAMDAQHKFFRLMVPCVAYTDSHMQFMSAAALDEQDVVVAISHTGRTKELLESVSLARQSGATVIAITAAASPLDELSSITLPVNVPEDTDIHTPMFSRIAHLVVIDVLALGVAIKGGMAMTERLRRVKDSLRNKRLPKELSK